ncbi:MAG: hypothetical protein ACOX1Q_04240 [Eubacteriales bacterium]
MISSARILGQKKQEDLPGCGKPAALDLPGYNPPGSIPIPSGDYHLLYLGSARSRSRTLSLRYWSPAS